ECDYVVVGSGAGGATVAARLAERGASVIVREAGGDPRALAGCDYDVPAFHALACENDAMKWDFYVQHYPGGRERVLYPRAGTLGGCTAHNAMIFVYPHNEDWDGIAELTGDASWRADNMRRYFQRLERCAYRPAAQFLNGLGINPSRHGFGGWLRTELPRLPARTSLEVFGPLWTEVAADFALDPGKLQEIRWFSDAGLDANDWRLVLENSTGLRAVPLTTSGHRRTGARERLLEARRRAGDRLQIELNCLATRVLFDERNRAAGVEYLRGPNLYRAGDGSGSASPPQSVAARREVIVAGGAFNTPQVLMLSGIGPPEHLRSVGLEVRAALNGVGSNLQDRYEIGVVNRLRQPWPFFRGATFSPGDPQYRQWSARDSCGVYTTNGAALSLAKRSSVAEGPPDLFCMLLLADFRGYYPGFSRELTRELDCMTWVVLKAHTRNRAGTVRLHSADPRDPPDIAFNYFEEGGEADLQAMVEGVQYVRKLGAVLCELGVISEELPGAPYDSADALGEFIRRNAWGHHASCTCAIGPAASGGVVSSDFRVHGVDGLRVVDASVFPKIPGFFIASSTYMIGEKAADVIAGTQEKGVDDAIRRSRSRVQ
ncbi:MAG: GMC family oxidoreductase, partial [Candidatus Eremiobacteraeota bacterium]|nr:GMC family oxidoreductase [Candidatus Eremiobacteraeota bacterium]